MKPDGFIKDAVIRNCGNCVHFAYEWGQPKGERKPKCHKANPPMEVHPIDSCKEFKQFNPK